MGYGVGGVRCPLGKAHQEQKYPASHDIETDHLSDKMGVADQAAEPHEEKYYSCDGIKGLVAHGALQLEKSSASMKAIETERAASIMKISAPARPGGYSSR